MSQFSAGHENAALGARLLELRRHLGLTQNAMADALGITARTFQNYERGEREISATVVKRLYQQFGIDPVWLLMDGRGAPRQYVDSVRAEVLVVTIEEVERRLDQQRLKLDPAKKAELISLIYQYLAGTQQPDLRFIDSALGLVA